MAKRSISLRCVLPFALVALATWLLAGCIYLPLPEHRYDKSRPDFRDMGGDAGSTGPFRPGVVTRDRIVSALGDPAYASRDGRAIGYTLETERAVWLWPLCFSASPAKQTLYGLRLVFDEHDLLTSWTMVQEDRNVNWFIDNMHSFPQNAIGALNNRRDGPELSGPGLDPTQTLPPATQP